MNMTKLQIINVKSEILKSLRFCKYEIFLEICTISLKAYGKEKIACMKKNTIPHNTYIIHMHEQMFWFYKRAGSFPQKGKRRKITEMKYKRKSQKTAFLWLKNNIHKNCYFQNIKSEIHH